MQSTSAKDYQMSEELMGKVYEVVRKGWNQYVLQPLLIPTFINKLLFLFNKRKDMPGYNTGRNKIHFAMKFLLKAFFDRFKPETNMLRIIEVHQNVNIALCLYTFPNIRAKEVCFQHRVLTEIRFNDFYFPWVKSQFQFKTFSWGGTGIWG